MKCDFGGGVFHFWPCELVTSPKGQKRRKLFVKWLISSTRPSKRQMTPEFGPNFSWRLMQGLLAEYQRTGYHGPTTRVGNT